MGMRWYRNSNIAGTCNNDITLVLLKITILTSRTLCIAPENNGRKIGWRYKSIQPTITIKIVKGNGLDSIQLCPKICVKCKNLNLLLLHDNNVFMFIIAWTFNNINIYCIITVYYIFLLYFKCAYWSECVFIKAFFLPSQVITIKVSVKKT